MAVTAVGVFSCSVSVGAATLAWVGAALDRGGKALDKAGVALDKAGAAALARAVAGAFYSFDWFRMTRSTVYSSYFSSM